VDVYHLVESHHSLADVARSYGGKEGPLTPELNIYNKKEVLYLEQGTLTSPLGLFEERRHECAVK
jgi:hypothetical protein